MKTGARIRALGGLGLALALNAQESATNVQFSAFGTLGFTGTDTHQVEFIRDASQPRGAIDYPCGSVDSRLGLQLSAKLSGTLLGTLQVVSKYRYDNTYSPDLQWASLTWNATSLLQVQAGRLGLEVLPNWDFANVGYTYLWVRPPAEVFGGSNFSHIDGAAVTQGVRLGGDTTLLLEGFAGTLCEKAPGGPNAPLDLTGSRLLGLVLKLRSGGFRGRISYSDLRPRHEFGPPGSDGLAQLNRLGALLGDPRPGIVADGFRIAGKHFRTFQVGGAWERGPVQIQAALADSTFHVALFPEQRSGFASFGYRLGDWVPYGVVARKVSRRAATPDLGRLPLLPGSAPLVEAVDQAIHLDEYDQTTVSAGLRWDFNDQADLKFQLDRVQMHNATGNWLVDQPGWNGKALVMSVTLDFIFGGVH